VSPGWRPLIADPILAWRAEEIVLRTARFFSARAGGTPTSPDTSPRLQRFLNRLTGCDGVPAVALFFAYLALERGDEGSLEATSIWLDRAVEVTSGLDEPKPWLASGIAGCGWVLAHALPRLAGPIAGDHPNQDIDATLAEFLTGCRGSIDPELTMGLAGLGTYYLENLPRPSSAAGLALVLEQLRDQAEHLPNGITWRKGLAALSLEQRLEFPDGLHNLGIPHGVPGVVAFLARVCAGEAASGVARELLEGAVSWLLDQKAPCGASHFPYFSDPRRGPVEAQSRLAWCYGDLGIAAVLLQAARAMRRADWETEALALADSAARRAPGRSGVEDGMICHGAAGIAHVFNRLHQASGRPALREAALRWYRETIDRDDPSSGPTGYRCLVREPEDAPDDDAPVVDAESYGIAVGIAGVALTLLAGLGRVAPDWDRVLAIAVDPVGSIEQEVADVV
jgi:lantibiotic biosynthesis protein